MTDLRQLRHFVALAEYGHFARAAEAVNLSQPALSRSIQALESQLDCRLLDRNPRGITLTAYGRLVLEHARRLLAGSRALDNAVRQLGEMGAGELRLGSGPFPAARLLPQVLAAFSRAYPKVSLVLSIENWSELHQRLLDDELELFVADCRELMDDPRLDILPLQEYESLLFCRPDHPLLAEPLPSIERLLDFPLAGPRLPRDAHHAMTQTLSREQPLDVQIDDVLVLKELVRSSDMLCVATADVVAADIAEGRLASLSWPRLEGDRPLRGSAYGLVRHASRSLSPAAAAFVELLLEIDRQPVAGSL